MKILADSLANVDAPVADRTLVMYLLNGLNAKYDNILNVIKHRQPFPTFDDAHTMLLDEEIRLKRGIKPNPTNTDHSSGATVLAVASPSQPPHVPSTSNNQHQFGNYRGRGRNNRGRGRGRNNSHHRAFYPSWNAQYWPPPYPMCLPQQSPQRSVPYQQQQQYQPSGHSLLGPQPQAGESNSNNHSFGRGDSYQATTDVAQAFNTMTLQDPMDSQWSMDSGATSHLTASPGTSFQPAFNTSIGKTVIVHKYPFTLLAPFN